MALNLSLEDKSADVRLENGESVECWFIIHRVNGAEVPPYMICIYHAPCNWPGMGCFDETTRFFVEQFYELTQLGHRATRLTREFIELLKADHRWHLFIEKYPQYAQELT
jgi:hypothetical protein